MLESETLQETDKHSAFCTSPSKLAFGECSEVSKLQKQRHVKEWVKRSKDYASFLTGNGAW